MNIQWYPGHMAKSKRLLGEKLKLINVAVIVLDARAPLSTFNPELETILSGKACIFVLNKRDLADAAETERWVEYYRAKFGNAMSFSATKDKKGKLMAAIQKAAAPITQKYKAKGMRKTIRVLAAGIPNVGKSAIINRLAGRKGAREGDRPGVTRGLQWVRLSDTLELMDSPGLLWPKIEDETAAVNIALTGCIRPEIIDIPALAMRLLEMLGQIAPEAVTSRYDVAVGSPLETLENICKKRGFLMGRGEYDVERASKALLDEFRAGRLGRITLESVEE